MTRFKMASCHEIGYAWSIEAPEGLNVETIQDYINEAVDEYDTFDEGWWLEFLDTMAMTQEVPEIELLKKVKIYTKTVHRNSFTQDFEKVTP